MRILLIEDDDVLAERLKTGLEQERYLVDWAADGQMGLEWACGAPYALILLDLMLPGRDGWSVCETLRGVRNNVPILMLTAHDSVEDRVRGLECGADDYLAKPFDYRELLARVRALLRRDKVHKADIVRIADLEIDSVARQVRRAGHLIRLTPHEFALLEALARNEGRTLTRDVIIEHVWGDVEGYSNSVNFHVTLLRKKIDVGYSSRLIHTVYGVGYVLRRPEDAPA
jgi:DNA-binding response OmpR family regulator